MRLWLCLCLWVLVCLWPGPANAQVIHSVYRSNAVVTDPVGLVQSGDSLVVAGYEPHGRYIWQQGPRMVFVAIESGRPRVLRSFKAGSDNVDWAQLYPDGLLLTVSERRTGAAVTSWFGLDSLSDWRSWTASHKSRSGLEGPVRLTDGTVYMSLHKRLQRGEEWNPTGVWFSRDGDSLRATKNAREDLGAVSRLVGWGDGFAAWQSIRFDTTGWGRGARKLVRYNRDGQVKWILPAEPDSANLELFVMSAVELSTGGLLIGGHGKPLLGGRGHHSAFGLVDTSGQLAWKREPSDSLYNFAYDLEAYPGGAAATGLLNLPCCGQFGWYSMALSNQAAEEGVITYSEYGSGARGVTTIRKSNGHFATLGGTEPTRTTYHPDGRVSMSFGGPRPGSNSVIVEWEPAPAVEDVFRVRRFDGSVLWYLDHALPKQQAGTLRLEDSAGRVYLEDHVTLSKRGLFGFPVEALANTDGILRFVFEAESVLTTGWFRPGRID